MHNTVFSRELRLLLEELCCDLCRFEHVARFCCQEGGNGKILGIIQRNIDRYAHIFAEHAGIAEFGLSRPKATANREEVYSLLDCGWPRLHGMADWQTRPSVAQQHHAQSEDKEIGRLISVRSLH